MTKEELDAEVYEYAKSRIGTEDSRMTDRMLAYRAGAEPREKQIAELEKENAELKSVERMALYSKMSDQLAQSKEHIRTLISCLIDWVQEGDKDYCHIADAKQFLKEIEK